MYVQPTTTAPLVQNKHPDTVPFRQTAEKLLLAIYLFKFQFEGNIYNNYTPISTFSCIRPSSQRTPHNPRPPRGKTIYPNASWNEWLWPSPENGCPGTKKKYPQKVDFLFQQINLKTVTIPGRKIPPKSGTRFGLTNLGEKRESRDQFCRFEVHPRTAEAWHRLSKIKTLPKMWLRGLRDASLVLFCFRFKN